MGGNLLANAGEAVAMILFGIGFANLLFQKNLIKKIIGFNIMDTAIYLFLAEKGYIAGRMPPIVVDGVQEVAAYINPIPSGLVLTGIVVSVSVSALIQQAQILCTLQNGFAGRQVAESSLVSVDKACIGEGQRTFHGGGAEGLKLTDTAPVAGVEGEADVSCLDSLFQSEGNLYGLVFAFGLNLNHPCGVPGVTVGGKVDRYVCGSLYAPRHTVIELGGKGL